MYTCSNEAKTYESVKRERRVKEMIDGVSIGIKRYAYKKLFDNSSDDSKTKRKEWGSFWENSDDYRERKRERMNRKLLE